MRQGWRQRALDRLAGASTGQVVAGSALLVAVVATLDWFSRAEIAASLGYLLPISLAAYALGRVGAGLVGILCAGTWLGVDLLTHGDDLTAADEVVNLIVLTVMFQLFGQLLATVRERVDHLRRLARTDALTGLFNRRALWSAVGREVARGRRQGTVFSIAYLDIDGFKQVNDRFGHAAGDELLRRVAHELQRGRRELDMVARLGGDEFVLLLPGADEGGAAQVIYRLRRRLNQADWQRYGIDFSVGVLTVLDAPDNVEEVVARADRLMYQVKRAGRGLSRFDVLRAPAPDAAALRALPKRRIDRRDLGRPSGLAAN